jgi:four helix bundle protein
MVDLKLRTKQYALRIIQLYSNLPNTVITQVIGKQLLRSGTSVGANYREAARARSNAEFISKANISLQELDEIAYWLELLQDGATLKTDLGLLMKETDELTAIFVTMIKNAKAK